MDAHRRRTLTLAATCLATFVAILDTSVVNLALHAIQRDLRCDVSTLQWILDAYNVTYASLILTGGALGDLLGRRRVFLAGIGLFVAGSLVCALAPGPATLVAGRALAGVGAGLQLPGALSILAVTYPEPEERSRAIAIWGGFNGLAMGIGPLAGGLLVDALGWRSIFYLVVPFGLAIAALAVLGIQESSDPQGRRLDPLGQALSAAALGLATFAFIEAPALGWRSAPIAGALAAACVACVGLVAAGTRPGALLPTSLFRNRDLSVAIGSAALMTFAFYGFIFLFPLYLQSVRGEPAVRAGLALLPMSLTFFALSPLAGRWMHALGAGPLVTSGLATMGAGVLVLSAAHPDTSYALLFAGLLAMGLGMATATGPVMTLAVSSLPSARSGTSSGLVNVGRMVGATLGVAVAGSISSGGAALAGQDAARFTAGMRVALRVGGLVEVLGAVLVLGLLGLGPLGRRAERPA